MEDQLKELNQQSFKERLNSMTLQQSNGLTTAPWQWPSVHLWHMDIYMRNPTPSPLQVALFVLPKPANDVIDNGIMHIFICESQSWLSKIKLNWTAHTIEAPSPRTALIAKSGTGSQDGRPITWPSWSHISDNRTGFGAVPLITPDKSVVLTFEAHNFTYASICSLLGYIFS